MGLLSPIPPPYDPLEWDRLPMPDKLRQVCRAWAMQGYGTPIVVFLFYGLKVAGYVAGWVFFCGFSSKLGDASSIASWWSHSVAFEKAILWSMVFEVMGFGCGSGPLSGRYRPPFGGFLYWLRPGTTKLSLVPKLPWVGGNRRTLLDVAIYAALLGSTFFALVQDEPTASHWLLVVVLLPVLGLLDKTIFLAARSEHYWVAAVCFAFSPAPLAGVMAVQLALWFFAGVSKLNHHFPAVVCVMASNSPLTRVARFRRLLYRDYPSDLRPSGVATWAGHLGTALELGVPIVLVSGDGGTLTIVGLILMVALHGFITSNVPMGVPIEWNVMVVYGGFVLFWAHPGLRLVDVGAPVGAFLIVMLVVLPIAGNLAPHRISFLLSMRYYAGNWANSVWLFRGESWRKLDLLTKSSPWVYDQLERHYDRSTSIGLLGKAIAFRAMHLHGRALQQLVPEAIAGGGGFRDYLWLDGEVVAGLALGWNFGDGHLHNERLLRALQEQCGFLPGEVRCVFIESQPLHRQSLDYRLCDATDGEIARGRLRVAELRARQPWPHRPAGTTADM